MTSRPVQSEKNAEKREAGDDQQESPEKTIARLQAELALMQKKIQAVGSITRHDVLNQMTAVMGYNELLLTLTADAKQRQFLEIGRQASDKMRRIFAYSKVFQQIGTEPPRWQKLDSFVHLACDEAAIGSVPVRSETAGVSLFAEPLVYKVFAYLFDNAVRHGKKTTSIRLRVEKGGGSHLIFIEDDGAGIPPADKEKIFEHGFGKYTGWGLFTAREILAVNGMKIRETGEPGAGARFEIMVPDDRIRIGQNPS